MTLQIDVLKVNLAPSQNLGSHFAPSWTSWAPFWLSVGRLEGHLGFKLGVREPPWLRVGKLWGHLGSKSEALGAPWIRVGPSGGHLGSKLGVLGAIFAPSWEVLGQDWLQDEGLGSK